MEILITVVLLALVVVLFLVTYRTPDELAQTRDEILKASRKTRKRYSKTLDRLNDSQRPKPTTVEFTTTNGYVVTIDAEDWERVSKHRWCFDHKHATNTFGSVRLLTGTTIGQSLKTFVLKLEKGEYKQAQVVRHKNHQPLDCRKSNLKVTKRLTKTKAKVKAATPTTEAAPIEWVPEIGCYRVRAAGKLIGDYRNKQAAESAYHMATASN